MIRPPLHLLLYQVRQLAAPPATPPPDCELLRRFAQHGDESAFVELLHRHGPLVVSVCRRLLWREQDIEDVFQATFLILARRAGAIRKAEALGCYLHSAMAAALADRGTPTALTVKLKGAVVLLALLVAAASAIAFGRSRRAPEQPQVPPALPSVAAPMAEQSGARTDLLGDPLPAGALVRLGTTRLRHEVFSFVFSPDSKRIASAGRDARVRLWDVATGKEVRRFPGHQEYAYSVAFSPDGKLLATGDLRSVYLWDLAKGEKLRTLALFETEPGKPKRDFHLWGALCLAFSPDGKTLLVGEGDDCLGLWDVSTGRRLSRIEGSTGGSAYAGFVAGGRAIVADDGRLIRFLNADGKVLHQFPLGDQHGVHGAAVTLDGRILAYGGHRSIVNGNQVVRFGGSLSLWDVSREKEVRRLELPVPPYGVAISPGGKTLAYTRAGPFVSSNWPAGKNCSGSRARGRNSSTSVFRPMGRR